MNGMKAPPRFNNLNEDFISHSLEKQQFILDSANKLQELSSKPDPAELRDRYNTNMCNISNDDLSDVVSIPSITVTNEHEYFQWAQRNQNSHNTSGKQFYSESFIQNKTLCSEPDVSHQQDNNINNSSCRPVDISYSKNDFENYTGLLKNASMTKLNTLEKNSFDTSDLTHLTQESSEIKHATKIRFDKLQTPDLKSSVSSSSLHSVHPSDLLYTKENIPHEASLSEVSFNAEDNSFEKIYLQNRSLLRKTEVFGTSDLDEEITERNNKYSERNFNTSTNKTHKKMIDEKNLMKHKTEVQGDEPRKDHYSYSYSYTTADPESGKPGQNSVEVNESVTEEVGPDGSKIIRRHQQEKQINKITQVVTQRVIKRQYIDPATGQIIEYDPTNELFANLPPETVFEEHTVVSDDNANNLPVITTTTSTKSTPSTNQQVTNTNNINISNFNNMKISESDYVDNYNKYSTISSVQSKNMAQNGTATASFRIKSHPEDNQGYPEERNMDYDPDDINCYPDDDLPYEGLIQSNGTLEHRRRRHGRGSASNGSTSSSSSPALFDSNSGIDMPLLSNTQHYHHHHQQYSSSKLQQKQQKNYETLQQHSPSNNNAYTTVLPSSNMPSRQQNSQNYYHTQQKLTSHSRTNQGFDPNQQLLLQQQQQQQLLNQQNYLQTNNYMSKQQLQQNSPSINNSNEYVRIMELSKKYMNQLHDRRPSTAEDSSSSSNQMTSSSDSATFTTTASINNRSSIYLQDKEASIAIHHHHFDAQSFIRNINEREIKRSKGPSLTSILKKPHNYERRDGGDLYGSSSNISHFNNDSGFYGNVTDFNSTGLVIPVSQQHNLSRSTYLNRHPVTDDCEANFYNLKSSTMYRSREHRCKQVTSESPYQRSVSQGSGIYWEPARFNKPIKEGTGLVTASGWRNPTLPEVIDYLINPSNEIKANACAYLQHLCYQDDSIKAETRALDGIGRLVQLLNSEDLGVHRNACGALRNLSYGKTNDENKIEISKRGGIPALIRLLKRSSDELVKESITAVLWNLSSCEEIKEPILLEGLITLVKYVIVPYSAVDILTSSANIYSNYNRASTLSLNQNQLKTSQRMLNSDYSNYPTVLTNVTGILRNCSSNLQFSNCYEARKKLRDCEGLIESLLLIVNQAVGPYMSDSYRQRQPDIVNLDLVIKDNMNSKCVENTMCILRNLSFRLQEIVDPNYDRDVKPIPVEEKTTKCVGGKKKKNFEEEFLNSVYPYNMPVPEDAKAQEALWSLDTLNKYLVIIKESTVRDTIEAAVGCLQNLTACYWRPSVVIRQEIRKLKGLPTLVHLLKSDEFEDEPIVSVTAIALRNLAIDQKNKVLIGKYAMKDLVHKLPDPGRPVPLRLSVLNEDTITAALACINECIKSSDEFVKSCYNEGGVKRMVYITRNGQHFPIKIVKYAAHVLASMWKHKNLHDLLKRDGYKETDFTSVAKQMGLKSQSSSPANTLHRPRGDVNNRPSQATSQKKAKKNSKLQSNMAATDSKSSVNIGNPNLNLNDMPIYSQVQKSNGSNSNNRNLIITNGTTNADSWV